MLFILPSESSFQRVIVQQGLKQTKSGVVWAHGGKGSEGTQCANSRMIIAESSLTCMCEGTERANQGQQEHQLNIHCGGNVSPSVTTFRAKSTTPEPSYTLPCTRQTHTNQPLRRGRVEDKKKGQE